MGLFGCNDITFCAKNNCPHRSYCRRAKWPKDDPWLVVSAFQPNPDGSCDHLLTEKKNVHSNNKR